ncbi:MAG: hypothetical protein EP335_00105 [Alphaproteobacteria bacterium]|nr:MAG: hypothetical protein EP335_00105 [Alphaproteobacteria bacterium]
MRHILIIAWLLFAASPVFASEGTEEADASLPRIDMNPFNFSLLNRGRVDGKVTLQLTLVVSDPKDVEFVRSRQPQIRSDFLTALTVLSRQRFSVNHPIDPDIVSAYLTPYADARLGSGKVKVYVKEALISRE